MKNFACSEYKVKTLFEGTTMTHIDNALKKSDWMQLLSLLLFADSKIPDLNVAKIIQ